jgi:hypothetical protein
MDVCQPAWLLAHPCVLASQAKSNGFAVVTGAGKETQGFEK